MARSKKGLGRSALKAVEAGKKNAVADLNVEAENALKQGVPQLLPLNQVKARLVEDTRPVDPDHVISLKESIELLGLIQPILVDREHRLIAGAHRLSAYHLLEQQDAQKWGKIPVVVDPHLSASEHPDLALRKEIAENEKRRNLTPTQVQSAARRLMDVDPSFTRKRGRLKSGERALTPFLATTFGVSVRHVRSLLNQDDTPAPPPSVSEQRIQLLKRIERQILKWKKNELLSEDIELLKSMETLYKRTCKIQNK